MPNSPAQPPDVLEALEPAALQANRRGRITGRQLLRLGRAYLWETLSIASVPAGCEIEVAFLVVAVALLVILIPIFLLLTILEWAFGARMEEGPLQKSIERRANVISVGLTKFKRSGRDGDPLQEGARHRIYFTRFSKSLINFERLGRWAPPIDGAN